jgi:hypothetical protein
VETVWYMLRQRNLEQINGMRLLLLQKDCFAHSWKDLRTVDDIVCDTFADATNARGLLNSQAAAILTIAESLSTYLHSPERSSSVSLVRFLPLV